MSYVFIAVFIGSIFVVDAVGRSWRQNAWKRRWKETE